MTITLYGIPNCDSVKKARVWLDGRAVGYQFHDYKKAGVDPALLTQWVEQAGWERVLNRAGTTFRKLPEAEKAELDGPRAIALMCAQPSMIKRPILTGAGALLVGFSAEAYAAAGL